MTCRGNVIQATGSNPLIDDFEGEPGQGLPKNDGRGGYWEFGSHHSSKYAMATFGNDGGNKYLHFSNDNTAGNAAGDPPLLLPEPWDPTNPWSQWAMAATLLQEWSDPQNCYDASIFEGIRFRAKSGKGDDKIRLLVLIDDENRDERTDLGAVHAGPDHTLTSAWQTFEVPFTDITQPSWVVGNLPEYAIPFDPQVMHSIRFAVRSVQPEEEDNTEGESLLPYDIWIDDLEFY